MKKFTFLCASLILAGGALNAAVFYVSPGGSGEMTGADWDNAFYIQDHQQVAGVKPAYNGGGVTMKKKTILRNCVVRNNSVSGDNVGGGVFVTEGMDADGNSIQTTLPSKGIYIVKVNRLAQKLFSNLITIF